MGRSKLVLRAGNLTLITPQSTMKGFSRLRSLIGRLTNSNSVDADSENEGNDQPSNDRDDETRPETEINVTVVEITSEQTDD